MRRPSGQALTGLPPSLREGGILLLGGLDHLPFKPGLCYDGLMTNTVTEHVGHVLLCTALEGGIGYWARAYDIERVNFSEDDWGYNSVTLVEFEDAMIALDATTTWFDPFSGLDEAFERNDPTLADSTHKVTAEGLLLTFRRAVTGEDELLNRAIGMQRIMRWAFAVKDDPVWPDLDAEDADVLLQVHIFGEIVYG